MKSNYEIYHFVVKQHSQGGKKKWKKLQKEYLGRFIISTFELVVKLSYQPATPSGIQQLSSKTP